MPATIQTACNGVSSTFSFAQKADGNKFALTGGVLPSGSEVEFATEDKGKLRRTVVTVRVPYVPSSEDAAAGAVVGRVQAHAVITTPLSVSDDNAAAIDLFAAQAETILAAIIANALTVVPRVLSGLPGLDSTQSYELDDNIP